MKVNIITFHFVHNFGAVLQCFALQERIKELGYDVEVINYRPEYHVKGYRCLVNPFQHYKTVINNMGMAPKMRNRIIAFMKAALVNRKAIKNIIRKHHFDQFVKEYLQQGEKCVTQRELTRLYDKKREIFVTGSDQIWNRKLIGNDNAYFLCFAQEKKGKIAYAASFGDEKAQCMRETASLLDDFDAISIREQTYAAELENILGRSVVNTLDPTLLLSQHAYERCEKSVRKTRNRKYILVYALTNSDQLTMALNQLLRDDNTLWAINLSRSFLKGVPKQKVINLQSIGPGEFLTCIKNAWYVLTDSFHGMAFSIIYHKRFWAFENKNGSLRLKDLIRELGMESRFISAENAMTTDWSEEIDYSVTDTMLSDEIAKSSSFLEETLGKG